jgi:putative membrane protein
MKTLKDYSLLFFKGVGMGAANVIPGVSGGTIAFITNIYEELIDSLKALNFKAVTLLFSFRFRELSSHINLYFLIALFSGIFLSIISLGKLLDYLFRFYPVQIWAFFFGLIAASVYFVGLKINRWHLGTFLMLITGTAIALAISFLKPAAENSNFIYLIICGVIAMASMLLPGLSGSFVLILMGNYQLIFLKAVPDFNLAVLIPVALGSILGLMALSHFISYILKKFRDGTIGLLTGFILGSLLIIWPWKNEVFLKDQMGNLVLKKGEKIIVSYERYVPEFSESATLIAILLMIVGVAVVWLIESLGKKAEA